MGESQVQVLVAGAPGLVAALEASGRFAKVFGCATTSALKDLIPVMLQSGVTQQQLVFVFCEGLIADTPGVSMESLIDKLTSRGWSVALLETSPNARVIVQAHPGAGLIPAPVSTNNVLGALSGMGIGLITPVAEAWGFTTIDVTDANAFAWMNEPGVAPIMQDTSPWGSAPTSAAPAAAATPVVAAWDTAVPAVVPAAAVPTPAEPWGASTSPVVAPVSTPDVAPAPAAPPAPWEAAPTPEAPTPQSSAPLAPWEILSASAPAPQAAVASASVPAPWETQSAPAPVEQPVAAAPWESAPVPAADAHPTMAETPDADPWATQSASAPAVVAGPWETAQTPAHEPWGVQAPAEQPRVDASWGVAPAPTSAWETAQAPMVAPEPSNDPWATVAGAPTPHMNAAPGATWETAAASVNSQTPVPGAAWEAAAAPQAPAAPWEAAVAPQAPAAPAADPWTMQAAAPAGAATTPWDAAAAPQMSPAPQAGATDPWATAAAPGAAPGAAQPWGVAPGPEAQGAQAPAAWATAAQSPTDAWTNQVVPVETPWGAAAAPATAPAAASNPWETAQAPVPIGGHTTQGAYPTQQQFNRRGLAIAVTVAKGGVGKSSLTLNLGAYLGLRLRELGRTVCVVDANFQQADIGKQINAYTPNIATLVRSMEDLTPERIGRHLLHRPDLNCSFLLGPSSPEEANPVWITPDLYGQCLEVLRRLYDYIIIDCPVAEFHHELFERFVLPSVDFLMVPVEPDIPTIMNTDNWLRAITAPQHAGGNGVDERRIGIVLNKAEEGIGVSQEDVMVNLANWAFLGTVPMSKEWRRARNQDEIVATRNYAELNTAFAKILYAITGEQDLLSGHGEVATKKKKFGFKAKKQK